MYANHLAWEELYNGKNTGNLALCHGDLHAGSVMATLHSNCVEGSIPSGLVFRVGDLGRR